MWVEDCFIYTTQSRLNYCVAGEVVTLAHLDRFVYLLTHLIPISFQIINIIIFIELSILLVIFQIKAVYI